MTREQAIEQSEAHWYRMIDWVGKRDGGEKVDGYAMWRAIHENWVGKFCPLCFMYYDDCDDCPLEKIGKGCCMKKSPWHKVSHSATWAEWLVHAREMLEILKGLK